MEFPPTLKTLWSLTECEPGLGCDYFDPVGLLLMPTLENFGYWCTPKNSLVFAHTGGDGVHFSFLTDKEPTDSTPIVMTVPMMDQNNNVIVGENLTEFLALGSRYGYFSLVQLVYFFDETIEVLQTNDFLEEATDIAKEQLYKISEVFSVKPWPNPKERLSALKDQYLRTVLLPDSNSH